MYDPIAFRMVLDLDGELRATRHERMARLGCSPRRTPSLAIRLHRFGVRLSFRNAPVLKALRAR